MSGLNFQIPNITCSRRLRMFTIRSKVELAEVCQIQICLTWTGNHGRIYWTIFIRSKRHGKKLKDKKAGQPALFFLKPYYQIFPFLFNGNQLSWSILFLDQMKFEMSNLPFRFFGLYPFRILFIRYFAWWFTENLHGENQHEMVNVCICVLLNHSSSCFWPAFQFLFF